MKKVLLSVVLPLIVAAPAFACDFCSIYTPLNISERQAGRLDLGVREDLLGYSKTRLDGNNVDHSLAIQNQKINVTELTAQYSLTDRFSALLAVPIISETFKRRINGAFDRDSESGVGDVALYGDVVLARKAQAKGGYFQWDLFGGVKLPSGSTDRLTESANGSSTYSETGIYGGSVTTGTGSYDFPIATGIHNESNNWLLDALIQYNLRTQGDYSYQFGNDLRWNVGFGRRFYEDSDFTFAAQLFLSGLSKAKDQQNGLDVVDSGQSFVAIGPKIEMIFSNRYTLFVRVDAPITSSNDGLQTLEDHRVQIGFDARL